MKDINLEKNLEHQDEAINTILSVFKSCIFQRDKSYEGTFSNPYICDNVNIKQIKSNIKAIQDLKGIKSKATGSNVIDIKMETGTGKTYTYLKTIFELNKIYGLSKFIIIVPTLSIKAGTVNFLESKNTTQHFFEQYSKTIQLEVVSSSKASKRNKYTFPTEIKNFISANTFFDNKIHVLLINQHMLNSKKTMDRVYDTSIVDKYNNIFKGISATRPFIIIDEPHKFPSKKTSWKNVLRLFPQFVLRFGATFENYENHIHTLSAMEAFKKGLVKKIAVSWSNYSEGENIQARLVSCSGKVANFTLEDGKTKKRKKLIERDPLKIMHNAFENIRIEKIIGKGKVLLSNGLILRKGDIINPFSYSSTLQEIMVRKTIKRHFKMEAEMMSRNIVIKPLTLFFIDNIDEYRNVNGSLKKLVENCIKTEIKSIINKTENPNYKEYLKKSLLDISKTHGGYFSKDNNSSDQKVKEEIKEILHDKLKLLDISNTRRFIFSKWTLKEGWDNPNIFQICKLRGSGSEISKLQEVGRGLRLPINQYGNRIKNEVHDLYYCVDFTEKDFADKLIGEISRDSNSLDINSEEVFGPDRNIRSIIRNENEVRKKVSIRREKYGELKELWEKINQKVVIKYNFKSEKEFKFLLTSFFRKVSIKRHSVYFEETKITINRRISKEKVISEEQETNINVSSLKYIDFLKVLSQELLVNIFTLHNAILEAGIDLSNSYNNNTIRMLRHSFEEYLANFCISEQKIEYQKVETEIHPTAFTNSAGEIEKEIDSSIIGINYEDKAVAKNYFLNELFFDGFLERRNIEQNISKVKVFTKIPRSSIRIPIPGGKSYSPDFAYVIEHKNKKKSLHLVVETKGVNSDNDLRKNEFNKIKYATVLFNKTKDVNFEIEFKTQCNNDKINKLVSEVYNDSKK